MALDEAHLSKLLKFMFLDAKKLRTGLLKDIYEEKVKAEGRKPSGPDFYGPFWADAKQHVFGRADLHVQSDLRIEKNKGRTNLYQRLRDGFLHWWNGKRRWTNEPFEPGRSLATKFQFAGLKATVKVENLLTFRDANGAEHFVYPYCYPDPAISEHAARLGLWLLTTALPEIPRSEIAILDVIRGTLFSLESTSLQGSEEQDFQSRYRELLKRRAEQKAQ